MTLIGRRNFLLGLGAAVMAAPAIIRPGILMPVKQMLPLSTGEILDRLYRSIDNQKVWVQHQVWFLDGDGAIHVRPIPCDEVWSTG